VYHHPALHDVIVVAFWIVDQAFLPLAFRPGALRWFDFRIGYAEEEHRLHFTPPTLDYTSYSIKAPLFGIHPKIEIVGFGHLDC